ncbi:MAG: IPTL-CTERM sorting domain-containing protein [candidate division Zixibacteria bacterium]
MKKLKLSSLVLTLTLMPVILGSVTTVAAGEIDGDLSEILRMTSPDEVVSVLVFLNEQSDLNAITAQMDSEKATLQRRHETVVRDLQQVAGNSQNEVRDLLSQLESEGIVEDFDSFWIANAFAVDILSSEVERIASHPDVFKVYYNYEIELIEPVSRNDDDGGVITVETGVVAVRAPEVWAMGITGAGVLVANMDTGVDGSHPALASRWAGVADPRYAGHPEWAWYDPRGQWSTPNDANGHGTHTMGTICGGSPGDEIGVAPGANWMASAPIDRVDIPTTVADAILSFQWMLDPDGNPGTNWDVPAVCSNSWGVTTGHGYPPCDQTFWSYLDACEAAGIVILFSAGNEGFSGLRRPSDRATDDYRTCAVAAVDAAYSNWPIAGFSSRGPTYCTPGGGAAIKPDISAPGVLVRSSTPGGGYASWSGTSMASPHVNGVVALMRQANPNLSVNEIKQVIYDTAYDLGGAGEDNDYGWGMIDAYEAVMAVSGDIGYVEGHLYETSGNTPIAGMVEVVETSTSATADETGYYSLMLPADTYTLRGTYHGYVLDEAEVVIVVDETIVQDFHLIPPDISTSPPSYSVSANPGETVTRDLYIDNDGLGELWFTLNTQTTSRIGGDPDDPLSSSSDKEPLEYRTEPGSKDPEKIVPLYPPVITGQGGPDTFGHKWIDSDESGGPPVDWIDISGPGTSVSLTDDDYEGPISIGFNFNFYENSYSQLYIGSNGVVTFGSGNSEYYNTGIPDGSPPNNFIAALWDDLRPPSGGNIYYYYDSANGRFIVSWVGVPFWYSEGSVNVQAVLYPNGNIELNYGTLNGGSHGLTSATVGIESVGASDGLQIVYDASYLHSNLSIRISSSWLSAEPGSGTVPGSGGSYTASVILDASDLTEGVYNGDVLVGSDDPDTPNITIPVTFNVGELLIGTLQGTVTDVSLTPISGVEVHADDGGGQTGDTNTNGSGFYTMDLQPGTYTVTFTHPDYFELIAPGVVVVEDQVTTQDAVLEEDTTQVPTLSEWGMILFTLLLLAIGTVSVIRRRKSVIAVS